MKLYNVTVLVESNSGKEVRVSHRFPLSNDADVNPYVKGFECGAAVAHDGAVLSSKVTCLGDYMSLRDPKNPWR